MRKPLLRGSPWLLALLLAACGGGETTDKPAEERDSTLAVSQPGELASYVQARLRQRPQRVALSPDVVSLPVAGAPAPARSTTTVQEAGVDEPDLLQSDGQVLYTLQSEGNAARLRVYGRDADGRAVPLKSLDLVGEDAFGVYAEGMVLGADNHALAVLSQRWHRTDDGGIVCADICPATASTLVPFWVRSSVAVQRVDVSDPAAASAGELLSIDGNLVSSRRIGDTLVLVTSYHPRLPVDALPFGASEAQREAAIVRTTAADVLPRLRRNGGAPGTLLNDTDCWVQPGNGSTDVRVTTITLLDLRAPTLAPRSRCFVGGSEALYMSTENLYLATTRWQYPGQTPGWVYPPQFKTDIHKFSLAGGGVNYRASGEVAGHLGWVQDQKSYRFSEWGGDLRVVTFTGGQGWATAGDATASTVPPSPAQLTVLRERASDRSLQPLATLPNARRSAVLGKPGEQLRAVRFIGNRGYVVTFRTIDPLYVLDLSDPADPFVAGALEVPGFSDQLFPLADGLLLGVGRDVTPTGRIGGLKLALFDARDPTQPRELASRTLGEGGANTALDGSPHGLNWLTVNGVARVALPASLLDAGGAWQQGLLRLEVNLAAGTMQLLPMLGAGLDPLGHSVMNDRSLQIGDQVHYLRDGGLLSANW